MKTEKRIIIIFSSLLFVFFSSLLFAQTPQIISSTEIKEVKVYSTGAMVTRTGRVQVNGGVQEIVFDGLSPYINPESIMLKGSGELVIENILFQQNYLTDKKKPKEITGMETLLDSMSYKSQQVQNKIATLNELQNVLQSNKSIGGSNNGVTADKLEAVVDYYNKKSLAIKDDILENNLKLKKITEQIEKIKQQLAQLNIKQNQPVGNIIVRVDAKANSTVNFELSYVITGNAGWYSFYDLRAKDINSPIELIYKAKVNQNTGEDWTNVKLKLNTGNPSESGVKPELYPWFLNFYEMRPMMFKQEPARSAAAEIKAKDDASERDNFSAPAVTLNENQLSSDFEIMSPYSIPSDGKEYQVEIQSYNLKASYIYEATPKADPDAFLIAKITNWNDLSLTAGSANVYFDGAYVGQSYINPAATEDTLTLSLGRDKKIIIKREKLKDLSGTKLFGTNKERSFSYEISVRNLKKEAITINILDQVPVSNNKDIEVKMGDNSGADYNATNGSLKWKLNIAPAETQKKSFSFSVKYPKDKQINGL